MSRVEAEGDVIFRFGEYELDLPRRELRFLGRAIVVQPQTFAMLLYLLQRRDRAVSKQELMDALWPDVTVSESSLLRTISLVRTALDRHPDPPIRTLARHGYRFVATVEAQAPISAPVGDQPFKPRYTRSGDVHIAYHVSGKGPLDIVLLLGWSFPMSALLARPETQDLCAQLRRLGRLVLLDKRGTGLSDRAAGPSSLDERVDDLRAVLDRIRSQRAILVGISEGGALAVKFSVTHPLRVHALALAGSFARMAVAPDYPFGWTAAQSQTLRTYIQSGWGTGASVRPLLAGLSQTPELTAWAASVEQLGATPGAALELLAINLQIDVRPLLPEVRAPTVVLQATRDPISRVENSRYLAEHIPDARYIEFPDYEHTFLLSGRDVLIAELSRLVEAAPSASPDGALAAVLCVEATMVEHGRSKRGGHERTLSQLAPRFAGAVAGMPWAALFESPTRALDCAIALRKEQPDVRVGIHVAEIPRRPSNADHLAQTFSKRLAEHAAPGEILISRLVADLIPVGRFRFQSRGPMGDPAADRTWLVQALERSEP